MRKQCQHCGCTFYGRTDKQFCSAVCKNTFHNQQRKADIAHAVDQVLHNNRSILHHLVAVDPSQVAWDRKVLLLLGFKFEAFTGISNTPEGKILHKVYEYTWTEGPNESIILERATAVVS